MKDSPDFHVVSLRYKLRPDESVSYVDPPPLEFETEDVRFVLADGKLTCEMKIHLASADEARAVVEPVLKAWEVDADLRWRRRELRFAFDGAEIIDRSPAPPGVVRGYAHVSGGGSFTAVGTAHVHIGRSKYPEAPGTFRLNPDAESLWRRFEGYLEGREPLLSMAYFCLTVLEANAGGREAAAGAYRIEKAALRKWGELTSERGDRLSARKMSPRPARQLADAERLWVEAAVKAAIWRLGDTRAVAALPWITMSDLPRV